MTLPYITDTDLKIAGVLKEQPADFIVQERPLYEPSGEGDHVYVTLTREGIATPEMVQRLAALLSIRSSDIGYAGLKDKQARTTQTFSLPLKDCELSDLKKQIGDELPVSIETIARHQNKLKRGHLLGNRFEILLRTDDPEALAKAGAIKATLQEMGIPNYFGVQRFGRECDNAARGRAILQQGRSRRDWKTRLFLSAYQSHLFNRWLATRIQRELFNTLFEGDIAKKVESGGLFEVQNLEEETQRFESREITYTGPIFGSKMLSPSGEAAQLEAEILKEEEIEDGLWQRHRLQGSRRAAQILVNDLQVEAAPEGLRFQFSLPKGSYATTVLRAFVGDGATD